MDEENDEFSKDVIDQLGCYVYRLIDPRDGQTFYVGRGQGNRVYDHIKGALKHSRETFQDDENDASDFSDEVSDKIAQIKEIIGSGLKVIHIIQRYGLDEKEAKEVEAALIDCFPGLTNIQSGYAAERGVSNAKTLQEILSAKPFDENTDIDYCIIKIRQETIDMYGSVYEAVRKSWKVNRRRIEKIPYVLASCNGIVKEVFAVDRWYEDEDAPGRFMFDKKDTPKEIQKLFKGKLIPEQYRNKGAANPVRYKEMRQKENNDYEKN